MELFVSTERILVLNTDLQEIMMDHSLRTISYIADIGDIVVLMARRNRSPSSPSSEDGSGSGGNSAMAADLAAKRQQHKMVGDCSALLLHYYSPSCPSSLHLASSLLPPRIRDSLYLVQFTPLPRTNPMYISRHMFRSVTSSKVMRLKTLRAR